MHWEFFFIINCKYSNLSDICFGEILSDMELVQDFYFPKLKECFKESVLSLGSIFINVIFYLLIHCRVLLPSGCFLGV